MFRPLAILLYSMAHPVDICSRRWFNRRRAEFWRRSGTGPIPWMELHPEGWDKPLVLASVYMPQQERAGYQAEVQSCLRAVLEVVLDARSRG